MKKIEHDLDLLYEVGSLRHVPRSWRQFFGANVANDLEHTLRVQYIALILSRMEKQGDEGTILKMALMHDLPETRTGDQNFVQKKYVTSDEDLASHDILNGSHLEDFEDLLKRYRERTCIESQIVKDADQLDVDLEMAEFRAQGHTLPSKYTGRKTLRDNTFFTQSARILWDAIETSDPHRWQVEAMKR